MMRIMLGTLAFTALFTGSLLAQGLEADQYQEQRRALTREWAAASTVAEKQAILARFRQLQLAEARAGGTTSRTAEAEALISSFTSWGNLDEDGLGANLAGRLPGEADLVREVFRQLSSGARDDVAEPLLRNLSDSNLRLLASDPTNRSLLQSLVGELNSGSVATSEEVQIERAVRETSRTHGRIIDAHNNLPAAVTSALAAAGATVQAIEDGSGTYNFDEYSVTIDSMPPGVTAQDFFMELARSPNAAVNDGGFNAMNVFRSRRTSGDPQLGDIYDIDILGPDDGSVVLADFRSTPTSGHFTFVTLSTPETGDHPEYGNREFGFFTNADGSVTFYTRGASRPANPAVRAGGAGPQTVSWTRMMRGISDSIASRGGTPRPDSFQTHRDPFRP